MLKRETYSYILSDSRLQTPALECLSQPNPENHIAAEISNGIREVGKAGNAINLYWVKTHVGIPGDERADELTKNAAIKDKRAPVYDHFPISFGK